jgi:hypothetical protein
MVIQLRENERFAKGSPPGRTVTPLTFFRDRPLSRLDV